MNTGDIVLTTGDSWLSFGIRMGQRIRYRFLHKPFFTLTEDQRRWTHYNHAALVLNADGDLAEALSGGVVQTRITKYKPGEYKLITTNVDVADAGQISRFAQAVLAERWRYSYWTIIGLIPVALGSRIAFSQAGTAICSGFVCDALTRAGVIWPFPPHRMMPADMAAHFKL